jgi:hypothetical protein
MNEWEWDEIKGISYEGKKRKVQWDRERLKRSEDRL